MIAVEVVVNGQRQCLAGSQELDHLAVTLSINGSAVSAGDQNQPRLFIGGMADPGSPSRGKALVWGTRIPPIAVGDILSLRVVDVPPQRADTPDSEEDLERSAFLTAKAKYLELKHKYEP